MPLVCEPAEVEAVARAIAGAELVAFDLEFASADRLVPQLCLLQVAWVHTWDAASGPIVSEICLIDPLAGDAAPVVHALAAHPLVLAHAPRQDLALLASRHDAVLGGVLDTQLMAAFAGLGDQLGLAALAGELLGVSLAKDLQWTDWAKRPLSDAHLAYAAADVAHLPAIYAALAARLGPRVAWVREESAQILADAVAAARVTPETAWRGVGGVRGLDAAAHAVVVELAAWRHRAATELDRPLGQVLSDKLLVELARHRPDTAGGVRAAKGLSPHARVRAEDIAKAIAGARPAAAPRPAARSTSTRAQRWAEVLLAIAHVVAESAGIAPRLLATRADAEEFARTVDEGGLPAAAPLPALATWRRELLGAAWHDWLAGRSAVIGDATVPHGIRLAPR